MTTEFFEGKKVKRIVAPDEVVHAAWVAWGKPDCAGLQDVVEAALCWLDGKLSRMVKPCPYDDPAHSNETVNENAVRTGFNAAISEVRGLFESPEPVVQIPLQWGERLLVRGATWEVHSVSETMATMRKVREPEVLEPIKDLLCGGGDAEAYFRPDIYNDRIIEAYRRGRSDAK